MNLPYYADCSHLGLKLPSFTIWTNIEGVVNAIRTYPAWLYVNVADMDDGHLCIVVTLGMRATYKELVQMIKDCATVENMLAGVQIADLLA